MKTENHFFGQKLDKPRKTGQKKNSLKKYNSRLFCWKWPLTNNLYYIFCIVNNYAQVICTKKSKKYSEVLKNKSAV